MRNVVKVLTYLVVAVASFYVLQDFRGRPRLSTADLQEKMDDIRTRAQSAHPDMAVTDAMKAVASEDAAKKLATQSVRQQASTAADMFWGFYFINTEARPAYCAQRGIDIKPFVSAFKSAHVDELSKAEAIYKAEGRDPKLLLPKWLPVFAGNVEQDMKDVTSAVQIPLEQACSLFNDRAHDIATLIQLPPHVKQALMAYD